MYLLLKLIKALNKPKLGDDEWGLLANIYASLEEKNVATFQAAYSSIYPYTAHIAVFMQSWFAIRHELRELNSLINRDLNEENRVKMLCYFLPADIQQLTLFAIKIEWLARVSIKHKETEILLRFFLKAITLKIDPSKDYQLSPENFALLQPAMETIYKKLLIKKLHQLCIEYLHSIALNIESYLNDHDELCILYYSGGAKRIDIHQLIREENEAITKLQVNHADLTPLFELLRAKYAKTQDLIEILSGMIKELVEKEFYTTTDDDGYHHSKPIKILENVMMATPTTDVDFILETFAACFEDYKRTFKLRISHPPDSFFSHHYTDEELEDGFIKTCSEIKEKIPSLTSTYRR